MNFSAAIKSSSTVHRNFGYCRIVAIIVTKYRETESLTQRFNAHALTQSFLSTSSCRFLIVSVMCCSCLLTILV